LQNIAISIFLKW